VLAEGHWGQSLREYMRDYNHWTVLGILAEFLPLPENRVTLAEEKDANGMPLAHFNYSQCENDRAIVDYARRILAEIWDGCDAMDTLTIDRYAHLVGGARMAGSADKGVVDSAHRVFGVPNLYVVDGSTLPTQGSANPALTIMALAARAADRLIQLGRRGLTEAQQPAS
jgi:choline dehydrogenase-like flavoprotein